ncbi:MAG: ribonuclease HI [Planctomycetes bacterium]|nr:ribonuclease HI [Planctomycetota bacterium]
MAEPDVVAWTDGGCRGNPGPGGWAFRLVNVRSRAQLERCGGEGQTTNNRMEIQAAVEALKALKRDGLAVLVHSDSQYLIKAASEWLPGWKARGWRRKEGELKNVDLLQELDRQLARHRVRWQWVKGHAGDPGNERVDALANQAMDRVQRREDPAWEGRSDS